MLGFIKYVISLYLSLFDLADADSQKNKFHKHMNIYVNWLL
jgi:hypothetical protein